MSFIRRLILLTETIRYVTIIITLVIGSLISGAMPMRPCGAELSDVGGRESSADRLPIWRVYSLVGPEAESLFVSVFDPAFASDFASAFGLAASSVDSLAVPFESSPFALPARA